MKKQALNPFSPPGNTFLTANLTYSMAEFTSMAPMTISVAMSTAWVTTPAGQHLSATFRTGGVKVSSTAGSRIPVTTMAE